MADIAELWGLANPEARHASQSNDDVAATFLHCDCFAAATVLVARGLRLHPPRLTVR